MAFCTKCGKELRDEDRFCTKCGAEIERPPKPPWEESVPVATCEGADAGVTKDACVEAEECEESVFDEGSEPASPIASEIEEDARFDVAPTDSDNEHVKRKTEQNVCPMCGETIPSLQRVCPSCGYELSRSADLSQVGKFAKQINRKINSARSSKVSYEKAEQAYIDVAHKIRDCQLDDDKDAMLDFITLAESGIDNVLDERGAKGVCAQTILLPAWQLKSNQICKRGRLLYGNEFGELLDSANHGVQQKAEEGIKRAKRSAALYGVGSQLSVGNTVLDILKRLSMALVGSALFAYSAYACIFGGALEKDTVIFELIGLLVLPLGTLNLLLNGSGFIELGISAVVCWGLFQLAGFADGQGFNASAIYLASVIGLFNCLFLLMKVSIGLIGSKSNKD